MFISFFHILSIDSKQAINLVLQVAQEIQTEAKYQNDFISQLVSNLSARQFGPNPE
jgi:energy-converting hydrogenase A subunit M